MAFSSEPQPAAGGDSRFASTQWSMVLLAKDGADPGAREALAQLCRAYWYPLYAYIRRQGHAADRAEELTQEFFVRFLDKEHLSGVDPARGRFRAFLLACCRNFLANEGDRARAQKRGGGRTVLSLDFAGAADRYQREPASTLTAEKLFDRRWALTLLDQVLDDVRGEYRDAGREAVFERLEPSLLGDAAALSYARVGEALGMTEVAVKKAAQRLRQRFRARLREQIAATVDGPDGIDDEIRHLFAALAA